jgi:hypothetical protein
MQDFYNKSLCKESEFMVDNFVIGQQVYRMESSRKDIGDVIKEHFEGVAILYQGDELWHTKNYFLMLTPSDVMYEALIDVLYTEDKEMYLRRDVNTRTIWEWEVNAAGKDRW